MSTDPIRDQLERKLNVEFCSEEELAGPAEPTILEPSTPRPIATVASLINRCTQLAQHLSVRNDCRPLLMDCAYALQQLTERLWALEHPEQSDEEAPCPTTS